MTRAELQKLREERDAREAAIDFLQNEWKARFGHARFSRSSLRKFFRLGLTVAKAFEAIDALEWKAEQNPRLAEDTDGCWRYFCGTCWNMINGVVLVQDE